MATDVTVLEYRWPGLFGRIQLLVLLVLLHPPFFARTLCANPP